MSKSGHAKGDTFRELLDMWVESGYCTIEESNDRFCWVGDVGDILLYEYARFDFMPSSWNYALFSNMQKEGENCSPWIFCKEIMNSLFKRIKIIKTTSFSKNRNSS